MGATSALMIITATERRGRRKAIQPGNREWATAIACISAARWAIPPFLILAVKYHLSSWYQEYGIPRDWAIAVSNNGWTNNEIDLQWLEHFDKHTKDRTVGTYRMLILDGHESHGSASFDRACMKKNIIPLYLPAHASHLLQPLDVGCFGPLKNAYRLEIAGLAKLSIHHISKETFIQAFKVAYNGSVTKKNILTGFQGSGIVPLDPDVVLSRIDIDQDTPPPAAEDALWESKTPSNAVEVEAQSTLLRNKMIGHQDSSPTLMVEALDQLVKSANTLAHTAAILRHEVAQLQKANDTLSKRKARKRKRVQKEGVLSFEEGERLATLKEFGARKSKEGGKRARADGGEPTQRRCKRCGETGHNSRTCKVVVE